MSSQAPFRWLHLSDFHVGKDGYGEGQAFKKLIEDVDRQCDQGIIPNVLFLTGDLAQSGDPNQYMQFQHELLGPLLDRLQGHADAGWLGLTYAVPGNHDVDREADASTRDSAIRLCPKFGLPTKDGVKDRRKLMTRFDAFHAFSDRFSGEPKSWLRSEEAGFFDRFDVGDQTVAIAGVNTAWFCYPDDKIEDADYGKLLVSADIVETAVESMEGANVKLLLGHHPLDWLKPTEREVVERCLADANVIYLHGHLHEARASNRFHRDEQYITVQSGAAFQAHRDDKWLNGFLWGEVDFERCCLRLQAREWDQINGWTPAPNRFHEKDLDDTDYRWAVFSLPGAAKSNESTELRGFAEDAKPFVQASQSKALEAPPGWTWIDQAWLDQYRKSFSDDDLIRFFDGRMPSWRVALSERVPRRAVVSQAEDLLKAGATEPGKPTVAFIQGAGGEGKSTAFHQTIVQLMENDPDWHVLWRDNDQQPLPTDWIAKLPDDGKPILIATDEADNIGRSLLAFIETIRRADHDRFHFLLAARDTDWRGSRPDDAKWRELSNFQTLPLRGIGGEDAEKIYNAWSSAGERGLGRLGGMSRDNAIRRLVTTSKDKEVDRAEGAFLGAMFELRFGDDFKGHVQKLLDRLKARGGRLYDAYAYVAAMHAENLLFLSSPVLAKELGCTEKDLRREVVYPLADEACGSVQGSFILTRHRTIAEAAIEIMEEQGEDRWSLITDLAEQAIRAHAIGVHVVQLAGWRFKIADLLAERGDHAKAFGLIETFLTIEPNNVYLLNKLAQLYRKSGDAEKAERLYRGSVERVLADASGSNARRGFFFEWSAAAGNAVDYALNIWLAGVSLSDWQDLPRLEADNVKLALAGMGAACRELFSGQSDQTFLKARGAAGQLGLKLLEVDSRARGIYVKDRDDAKAAGVEDMSVEQAVRAIEAAVQRAFEQCRDADELVNLGVPYPPDEFGFSSLQEHFSQRRRPSR